MKLLFDKPKIFIGSASESLDVANAIQSNLDHDTIAVASPDSNFALSQSTLSSLLQFTEEFDFAVFVLTPDDETIIRTRSTQTTRANVIFELGLFLGALGSERTFFVVQRGSETAEPPTDLLGITPVDYDPKAFNSNKNAALRKACTIIKDAINHVGLSPTLHFRSLDTTRAMHLVTTDESLNQSPLALDALISRADKEIFVAAQNHHHVLVSKEDWFKQVLFDFLKDDSENRRIRFLMCDPDSQEGKKAWGSLFLNSELYDQHLTKAYNNIKGWINEAKDLNLKFEAVCVPLVPVSINFIDPEDEQGIAVVAPNLYEHKAKDRTAYLISKTEHRNTFNNYWQAYEYAFENPTKRIVANGG